MSRPLLPAALRQVWPNLPVLALGSVLVAFAWGLARVAAAAVSWAGVVLIGLLVLPLLGALLRGCLVLLTGDHFGIGTLVRTLPSSFARGLRICAPVTGVALLGFAGTYAWQVSGSPWLLPSAALGSIITLGALYVGIVALPYYVGGNGSWLRSWQVGLFVATRNPVPVLATMAAVVLAVLAAEHLSVALVLVLPAPVALVWASALRTATEHSRQMLAATSPQKGAAPR